MENSNLPCKLLWWLRNQVNPSQILLVDYYSSKHWRGKVGFNSDRLPKLFALSLGFVTPYEHLFVQDEVINFVKRIQKTKSLDNFILKTEAQVEEFLNKPTNIKHVFYFFDLAENDPDDDSKKDQIMAYMLTTLASDFLDTRIVTSMKIASTLTQSVAKKYQKNIPSPDEFSLLEISCGKPLYVLLTPLANQMHNVTLTQFLRYVANVPSMELDKTSAGLAVSRSEKQESGKGKLVFTISTKITDYSEVNKRINSWLRELYCDFRSNVHLAWVDTFFNPARLSLMGHNPSQKYFLISDHRLPLGALVDFTSENPYPMPENMHLTTSNIKEFINDCILLKDNDLKKKYYNRTDELAEKRSIIKEFKHLYDSEDVTEGSLPKSNPNKITINLSDKLSGNQIRQILRHVAHARRRLELIGGKSMKGIGFGISISPKNDNQTVDVVKDHKLVVESPISKLSFNAKYLMKEVSKAFQKLPLDELSHIPEERLAEFEAHESGATDESYLYDDL